MQTISVPDLSELYDVPLQALQGDVSAASMSRILAAAGLASSAANLQPWTIVHVTTAAARQLIADNSLNSLGLPLKNHRNEALLNVAELVLVCLNVLRGKCRFGQRGLDLYAIQDCAAAATTMRLAAQAEGVSSHWVREIDMTAVAEGLALAPRLSVQALIAFGARSADTAERPPRLPAASFIRSV